MTDVVRRRQLRQQHIHHHHAFLCKAGRPAFSPASLGLARSLKVQEIWMNTERKPKLLYIFSTLSNQQPCSYSGAENSKCWTATAALHPLRILWNRFLSFQLGYSLQVKVVIVDAYSSCKHICKSSLVCLISGSDDVTLQWNTGLWFTLIWLWLQHALQWTVKMSGVHSTFDL